jgi:hypothetical protein
MFIILNIEQQNGLLWCGCFDIGLIGCSSQFWSTILNNFKMCFSLTHLTQFLWYRHPYYCFIYVVNVFTLYLSTETKRFRYLDRFLCDISLFVFSSVIFESPTKNDIKISVVSSLWWWYYALIVFLSWNIVEECSCKWVFVRFDGVFWCEIIEPIHVIYSLCVSVCSSLSILDH